jgi:hypothetical protein
MSITKYGTDPTNVNEFKKLEDETIPIETLLDITDLDRIDKFNGYR